MPAAMFSLRFMPPERFFASSLPRSCSAAHSRHHATDSRSCPRIAREAAKRLQVFRAAKSRIDRQLLRNPAERRASFCRAGNSSKHGDPAFIRNDAANNAADDRAFPRAIGPKQTHAFACSQFQRYAGDGLHCAKTLDQRLYFKRKRRVWSGKSRSHQSSTESTTQSYTSGDFLEPLNSPLHPGSAIGTTTARLRNGWVTK